MFDHVHFGVSSLEESKRFYEAVLAPLEIALTHDDGELVEFGDLALSADSPASRNVHIAFPTRTRDAVHDFYRVGIEAAWELNRSSLSSVNS